MDFDAISLLRPVFEQFPRYYLLCVKNYIDQNVIVVLQNDIQQSGSLFIPTALLHNDKF